MVSTSTRTQVSPLDEVISGAVEAVDMWVSEFSRLVVLSVVTGILEAAEEDAR